MNNLAYKYKDDEKVKKGRKEQRRAVRSVPSKKQGAQGTTTDQLQIYLNEIRRYDLLSREEEIEVARRAAGQYDDEAVNRLVTSNLRLVVKIAMDFQRYWNRGLLDLIQEGNLGLMQASRKFDPERGIKFSYYASFWIKAYISKFIMDNWKLVKIGTTQNQRKLFHNLVKEQNRLIAEGYIPEPKLIAERLDVKEEEVVEMAQRLEGEVSINAPLNDNSRESFGDTIKDMDQSIDDSLSVTQRRTLFGEKLKQFRLQLSGREADIFDRRIMSDQPAILQELGDKHQISRERVRQIERKIIQNIRAWSQKEIPNFEQDYADLAY